MRWMSQFDDDRPRAPRAAPEILPPAGQGPDPRWQARDPRREPIFVRQRVYVARPGPLALVLGLFGVAALGFIGAVAFLSLAFFLLPLAAVGLGALVVAALLRGPRRF